ncbi:hypothetical protein ABGC41_003313 [Escherichia coli]
MAQIQARGTATRARQQADAPRARKSRASRRPAPESPLTGTGLSGQLCGVEFRGCWA